MRIVSLIASATEIVHALGLGDRMVGRSHECDFPESVKALPVCTSPKFNTDGTSYQIDDRVRAVLQESLSVYRVYSDILAKLQPSHIITQSQCEVCAVSLKDIEAAACELMPSQPEIISLEPNCLDDVYHDIDRVGTALGARQKADELATRIKLGIKEIADKAAALEKHPTVALIEWIDPLMAGGNWMPELVELAGGKNLFGEPGQHSQVMSWKEIADANPDIIVVAPCGFDTKKTLEDMPLLKEKQGWSTLKAVRNKRVYIVDGNQYFNRPGPRVLESLQIMAEIIHPESFHFGFENKAWMPFK